jgi:hypothetical protein
MSSATSTEPGGFRAWHFFVLAGILAATAAVFLARQTSAVNVLLLTVSVWAAGLAGLALHRTLAPLAEPEGEAETELGSRTRAALEREKSLVLRSIKELEFDRAMGKVADADFNEMVGRLRSRALSLLTQLDAGEAGSYRELIERELRARLAAGGTAPASREAVSADATANDAADRDTAATHLDPMVADDAPAAQRCPVCETANDPDARFCKRCGEPLGTPDVGAAPREAEHG